MRLDDWYKALVGIVCAEGTVQMRLERALDLLCDQLNARGAILFSTREAHPFVPLASSIREGDRQDAASILRQVQPSIEWLVRRGGPDISVQTPSTVTVFSPRTLRSHDAATTFGLVVDAVPLDLADHALCMAEQVTGWYAGSVEHHEVHRAERRRLRIYEKAFRDAPHPTVLMDADAIILDANTAATALLTRNDDVEALCGTDIGVWLARDPTVVRASGEEVQLIASPTLDEKQLIWIIREPGG